MHVSSISSSLPPNTSPGRLGRKKHLLNAARLLLLEEPEQEEAAAPCPAPVCCIFPLVSSAYSSMFPEHLCALAE